MLTVEAIDTFYGRAQVLFGVGLDVGRGEVVALLGRNGAGKSTVLKSIFGLVPPAAGRVTFEGHPLRGRPPYRVARLGVGYVPENRRIFAGLTVAENLEVGRRPPRPGVPAWTPERLFGLFPNLAEIRGQLGGRTSGGEQQMLTIARTLMANPTMLLLDEPSEGLAPRIVEQLADMIRNLKAEGLTILVAEQNLRFAARIADRAAVIETGHIRWHGPMAAFTADPQAQSAFLQV